MGTAQLQVGLFDPRSASEHGDRLIFNFHNLELDDESSRQELGTE